MINVKKKCIRGLSYLSGTGKHPVSGNRLGRYSVLCLGLIMGLAAGGFSAAKSPQKGPETLAKDGNSVQPTNSNANPASETRTPRPPEYVPEEDAGLDAAPAVGNPDSDPDVDVGGRGVEVTLAAHGDNIVAGWVDQQSGTRCGWASSQDGGETWGERFITPTTSGNITGDPTVAVDDEGTFYLVCQDYGVGQLRFSKSTDGGVNWTDWENFQATPDKPWVAGVRDGTVYVTWLGSPGGFKRSLDGGETWESVKSLGNLSHGTMIGTGNTGLVHILFNVSNRSLRYVRSTDWGATLESGRNIVSDMGSFCFGCNPRQHPIVGGGSDPTGQVVAATWSARRSNSDGEEDVHIVISRDAGDTWTDPIKVNDNSNSSRQFLPWAAVDGSGKVHVIWTDMRDDRNAIYYSYIGEDNEVSENVEITDETGTVSGWFGDYQGIVVDGNDILVAWSDTREGSKRIYFSRGVGLADGGTTPVKLTPQEIKSRWKTNSIYNLKGAKKGTVDNPKKLPAGKYLRK